MKKFFKIISVIARIVFVCILLWFCAYFIFGDQLALKFSNQTYSNAFVQILTFSAAVSVYGFFVLSIRAKQKKWLNVILFFGGLLLGCLPLLIYHGYLQYQCGFWNETTTEISTLYINTQNENESVKRLEKKCSLKDEIKTDTVFVRKLNDYFELEQPVKIRKSEKGNWKIN